MIWQPLNLTEVCPTHHSLTACSSFGYVYLGLLVHLFGGSKDVKIQNSLKDRGFREDEGEDEEYDFIVVGAGAAGCVVANRLTEFPDWKVLLLEAGPEQPDITLVPALSTALLGSNIDWAYTTEPDGKSCLARPGGRCDWPRGKTMGGSSSINSLAYVRGNKVDYDDWAALGNKGWSYEDVLPYFKKSEKNLNVEGLNRKYHGVDGEQSVSRYPYVDDPSIMMTEGFNQAGLPILDFNGAYQQGTMQSQAVSQDGERVSTNNAFIQPIRYKRGNLVVKTDAEATKILFDNNKRAYGVVYIKNGTKYKAVVRKEVIVAAGSINSPKLLMLSGLGPRSQLEKLNINVIQSLAVGENLHDHVTFNGVIVALNKTSTLIDNNEMLQEIYNYSQMEIKDGPIASNGPVSSIGFYKTRPDLPAPDIQYQVDHAIWREYINDPTNYERATILPTAFYDGMLPRTMNLVPKSRGRLVLNATHPNAAPLIYANYFDDPEDLKVLVRGVRFLLTLEKTPAFKARGAYFVKTPLPACKQYAWGTDEYFICLAKSYTTTTYHPVGTCKMGPVWDRMAVVDHRLRVYGVAGLRVIDSSIMPVVPRGNTNAPSIMIGERGVALVIEDWLKNYQ